MSFSIQKRTQQSKRATPLQLSQNTGTPFSHNSAQRGTSLSKYDQNMNVNSQGNNKSIEIKKGVIKTLTTSVSTQNLEMHATFDPENSHTPPPFSQISTNLPQFHQSNPHKTQLQEINSQQQTQVQKQIEQMGSKINKIFDRMGYLEDVLSRVELQQDSMRPMIKMLEQSQNHQKISGQRSNSKQVTNKENNSTLSSFVSQANSALLDKLTKNLSQTPVPNSQNNYYNQQNLNNNSSQDTSLFFNKETTTISSAPPNPIFGYSREELDKIIQQNIDRQREENERQMQLQFEQLAEKIANQIENIKQDVIRLEENQRNYSFNGGLNQSLNGTNVIRLEKSNDSSSQSKIQSDLASFKAQFGDQLHFFKSKLDILLTKVDSMDLSYDKRISNLEVIVTPIITQKGKLDENSQGLSSEEVLEVVRNEYSQFINGPEISMIVDEKVRLSQMSQQLLIQNLETELQALKQAQYKIEMNHSLTTSQVTSMVQSVAQQQQNRVQLNNQTTSQLQNSENQQESKQLAKNDQSDKDMNKTNSQSASTSNFNTQTSNQPSHRVLSNQVTQDNYICKEQQKINQKSAKQNEDQSSHSSVTSARQEHFQKLTSNSNQQSNVNSQQDFQQAVYQTLKKVSVQNNSLKSSLDSLESHILSTSESINDRVEDIQKQMGDLHKEILANIDLVKEKKKNRASDTEKFIKILGEDVKQFISCMREEVESALFSINERDEKCKLEMQRIESKLQLNQQSKQQLLSHPYVQEHLSQKTQSPIQSARQKSKATNNNQQNGNIPSLEYLSTLLNVSERNELLKLDAFREHTIALRRHLENTSSYLQKQIVGIDAKIESAKDIMRKELNIEIVEEPSNMSEQVNRRLEKEIREIEEEQNEDDEEEEVDDGVGKEDINQFNDHHELDDEEDDDFDQQHTEENDFDGLGQDVDQQQEEQFITEPMEMLEQEEDDDEDEMNMPSDMMDDDDQHDQIERVSIRDQFNYKSNDSSEQISSQQQQQQQQQQKFQSARTHSQSIANYNASQQPFSYQSRQLPKQSTTFDNTKPQNQILQVYDSVNSNQFDSQCSEPLPRSQLHNYPHTYQSKINNFQTQSYSDRQLDYEYDSNTSNKIENYSPQNQRQLMQTPQIHVQNIESESYNHHNYEGSTVIDESEPHRAQKSPTHTHTHSQFNSNGNDSESQNQRKAVAKNYGSQQNSSAKSSMNKSNNQATGGRLQRSASSSSTKISGIQQPSKRYQGKF